MLTLRQPVLELIPASGKAFTIELDNFHVVDMTRSGIEPRCLALEADAFTTIPSNQEAVLHYLCTVYACSPQFVFSLTCQFKEESGWAVACCALDDTHLESLDPKGLRHRVVNLIPFPLPSEVAMAAELRRQRKVVHLIQGIQRSACFRRQTASILVTDIKETFSTCDQRSSDLYNRAVLFDNWRKSDS